MKTKKEILKSGCFCFGSCTSLKNVILPLSLKEIGWNAFNACTSLKYIFIPRNVSFIGKSNIFSYCRELTSVVVDKNNAYYDSRSNCNAIIQKSDAKLIAACRTTVIPEGVRELDQECCYAAFMHKLKIPKSVENIDGSAFNDCFELDSIIVMKGNSSYTSPTGSNVVLTKDGQTLVVGCRTSVIPNGVKKIGDSAFFGKYVQPFLKLPDGVEKIGNSAFQNCQGLTSVIIPASIKEMGSMAFAQCSNLASVSFLSTPELIEKWTFKDCYNLSVVNLSQGLKTIENWAFQDCTNLKQIFLPSTVTNIEKDAFINCPATIIKK